MAETRQTTIGPEDLGPQDVFVINDISLTIPPTQITVAKEDLTYQWRTLRTKSSTKIPTGHGQVSVHVSIPFTSSQFLSLHRLIVQFRHSPFCYIDNRYLRESIVPEWPYHQNMAFTMTNIHLTPYRGSSDTWMIELDLIWFNYFPYMHNFLFREDWTTKAILGASNLEEPSVYQYTIGWTFDRNSYKRTSQPVVASKGPSNLKRAGGSNNIAGSRLLDTISSDPGPSSYLTQRWSVTQGLYEDKTVKTLYDMEVAHAGEEFDLLPLPGNMSQARAVSQPRNSRIYTRYINLLQRDALWKNFEIDVEADMAIFAPPPESDTPTSTVGPNSLWSSFFSSTDSENPKTYGLHTHNVPRVLRRKWVREMLNHNFGVRFVFHAYQDIKLPKSLTDSMDDTRRAIVGRISELANLPGSDDLLEVLSSESGESKVVYQEQKRKGYFKPLDKHIPIGKNISDMLASISKGKSSYQNVHVRSEADIRRIYGQAASTASNRLPGYVYGNGRHSRIHYGTDFAYGVGEPCFAVQDGIVTRIDYGHAGGGTRWVSYDVSSGRRSTVPTDEAQPGRDFYESVLAVGRSISDETTTNRRVKLTGGSYNRPGAYIPSVRNPDRYYVAEYGSGGQQLTIRHDVGGDVSYSYYSHIDSYPDDMYVNKAVSAGDVVAFVGNTSQFSDSYLQHYFTNLGRFATSDPEDQEDVPQMNLSAIDPYFVDPLPYGADENADDVPRENALGAHLHYEYWEARTITDPQNPGVATAFAPTDVFGGDRDRVVVDIKWSYELARNSGLSVIEEIALDPETITIQQQEVIDNLESEGVIDSEVAVALTDMFQVLESDGWKYYDKDTTIVNVWEKVFAVTVANSGADIIDGVLSDPQTYINEGALLVNISGQLSHIVANLPVLSHEFPTQQHLGSIEPSYNMSFAILDDQSNLEGISTIGTFLEGMRSILQHNARKFRPVADGWCISTDTFLTRMLGSFNGNDVLVDKEGTEVVDFRLRKRTAISRSTSATVEGQPGLSMLSMTLEETNPYETEEIVSTAPKKEEVEEARRQVLKALFDLDFIEQFQSKLLPLAIAQLAGATTRPGGNGFGEFTIEQYNPLVEYNAGAQIANAAGFIDISSVGVGGDIMLRNFEGQQYLLIRSTADESSKRIYEKLLPEGQSYDETLWTADNGTVYIRMPLSALDGQILGDFDTGRAVTQEQVLGALPNPVETLATLAGNSFITQTYDMTDFFEEDPNLGEIPFAKIRDYYIMLIETIHTGERMLAESEVGGISDQEISSALYNVPIRAHMWQSWQTYLEGFVFSTGASLDGRTALQDLRNAPNYPTPRNSGNSSDADVTADGSTAGGWNSPLDATEASFLRLITSNQGIDYWSSSLGSVDDKVYGYFKSIVLSSFSSSISPTAMWSDFHNVAINRLVSKYMSVFPYVVRIPDSLKGSYSYLFGDLLGNNEDGQSRSPAFASIFQNLATNAYSCGNIRAAMTTGGPYWMTDENDQFALSGTNAGGDLVQARGGFIGGLELIPTVAATNFISDKVQELTGQQSLGLISQTLGLGDQLFGNDAGELEAYLYPKETIGAPLNSAFQYPTSREAEDIKLRYLAQVLSVLADDLLSDIGILRAFGLEHLAYLDRKNDITGSECYPDMTLPFHPYYGDEFQTSPDFYMWNIYEDGGAFGVEDQEAIYKSVDTVVQNCYDSLHRVQKGIGYDTSKDQVIQEPGLSDSIVMKTQMLPEGTDRKHDLDRSGPSTTPWASVAAGVQSEKDFQRAVGEVGQPTSEQILTGLNPKGIRIAQHEGTGGKGAGIHYHARGDASVYTRLSDRLQKTESMFGSQAGFANQRINPSTAFDINNAIKGTNLEPPIEDSHTYSAQALKQLARDSSKDMLSYKMSMRRAYPTFKLFFVEEDQDDGRFLSFDDFYSYNAVKEFSVVMSRKMPADHAVIVVQNISGTLDGTKRNAVADLDYFDRTAEKKLEVGIDEGSRLGGDARFKDTNQEQPFGSLVLRPGLNVQLRCGYSNDPDNLHVMVSGRVVDLSWNKTGDLAEIMVQSFGTELIQAIKGQGRDGQNATYATTHELLGSLMLEPEVVHFGRWAFGQLFQRGESSDFRLDFNDYSREGFMGRFRVTNWITQWVIDHPKTVFAATAGATLLSFLPVGRAGGLGGKVGSKILPWFKSAPVKGTTGWTKAFAKAGVPKGTAALSAAQRAALAAGFKTGIQSTYGVAKANAGARFAGHLLSRRSKLLKKLAQDGITGEKALLEIVKYETYLQTAAAKGLWMAKPWVSTLGVETLGAVGFKPFSTAFSTYLLATSKALVGATAFGLGADFLAALVEPITTNKIKKVREFFQTKQAHMFLSPQDDNLYPPHPKDYMAVRDGKTIWGVTFPTLSEGVEAAATLGARIVLNADQDAINFGAWLGRLIEPDKFISKKVPAEACEYQLISTTIWDVFHEMSLRHPGWIYGPRPYGTEFRYTMFFGPPAQRYWSKPASNRFIQRANDLRRYLGTTSAGATSDQTFDISKAEFEFLYGVDVYQEVKAELALEDEARRDKSFVGPVDPLAADFEEIINAQRERKILTSIAMKEYLRSLEIRFTPFRKYHMFTSDRDIIWNGIMSSEQAVINAVDVNYFNSSAEQDDIRQGPVASALFKAHSFIPEHMLRVAPVSYPNIKGYEMAMRYGMGSLLHSMRDMYRGEILLLGNPRIRPWDVGILVDTYNDMVGPVEIEQVVHTLSHETGFVSEIKPSAVVFANEISGWPMVEAMKLFAMAVKDIESRYTGMKAPVGLADTGAVGIGASGINALLSHGDGWNSFIEQKYRDIFPADGSRSSDIFGDNPPNTEMIDTALDDMVTDAYLGMGILGAVTGLSGTVVGRSVIKESLAAGIPEGSTVAKTLIKQPRAVAAGAAVIAGGLLTGGAATIGAMQTAGTLDFPSLVWLVGGPVLFLQCLRNEAVVCVPLIKNGQPIVSGLSFQDPGMIWNQFRGQINRWADDTISGTADMVQLYRRYGSQLWNGVGDPNLGDMTGERNFANSNGVF